MSKITILRPVAFNIESVNDRSKAFAKKLGFHSIDRFNFAASVKDLLFYYQD